MSGRARPKTQREMVEQLWDEVVGTNGDGLITRFEKHCQNDSARQDIIIDTLNGLTSTVANLAGKLDGHMDTARPTGKTITLRRILEVATVSLVIGGCLLGAAMIFAGKLTPHDIVEILEAWKGAP